MTPALLKRFYAAEDYYVVMNDGGILFAESPEDQGLDEGAPQENLIRLFVDKKEGNVYCDYVSVVYEEVKLVKMTLQDLWYLIEDAEKLSRTMNGFPLRIAFTELDGEGWPIGEDTIYSAYMIPS